MYPTLYHAIKDLFGFEFCLAQIVQTFGFFVAIAFLVASYFFAKELKRKESDGLLKPWKVNPSDNQNDQNNSPISGIIIGFLLGFKLSDLLLDSCALAADFKAHLFSMEGNIWGAFIGAAIAYALWLWEKKKNHTPQDTDPYFHPHQLIGNFTMVAALFGFPGAKLFHLLENPDEFNGLFDSFNNFFAGLTMYGGLFVGGAAVLIYARKKGLQMIHVVDACAPALMLAYGLGRMGCQFAGDGDWGLDNLKPKPDWLSFLPDWAWSYTYPHNVIHAGVPIPDCMGDYCYALENPVWPTPFYEIVASLLIFALLWSLRKRFKVAGLMTCTYLFFNGVERFFIEKIRINSIYEIFSMEITQAEIISSLFILVGIAGWWYLLKKPDFLIEKKLG